MIRQEIYNQIAAALAHLADYEGNEIIQHLDFWNQNVMYAEQEEPWGRPAVFVEIGEIHYSPTCEGGVYRTQNIEVRLHIVLDYHDCESYTNAFLLTEAIARVVTKAEPTTTTAFKLVASYTSHNHEELLEMIEVFTVRATRHL